MTIELTGADIPPIILIGVDPTTRQIALGPIGQLRLDGRREVQPVSALRRATKVFHNRDNRETSLGFTARREHASKAEAESFAMLHEASLPSGNAFVLTITLTGTSDRLYLSTARLTSVRHFTEGVETLHTYDFIGGALVRAATL